MKEVISVVSYWFHLTATVIWIGGIFFILFIAMPSAKQVLGAEAGKMMGEISKRFTPLANYSILLIILTGIVLTGFNKQFSGLSQLDNNWALILILKHALVLGMVAVHFYRGLILTPKIIMTASTEEKTAFQKKSINLVKVNFSAGILVLLLSGIAVVLAR